VIMEELNGIQGQPVDMGGYYKPSPALCAEAMCPSATFKGALASL